MAIDQRHPEYFDYEDIWQLMRDSYKGERAIKKGGELYLPKPASYKENLSGEKYDAYVTRAVYHDFVNAAVKASIGIMHRKPPIINLPPEMEDLRNNATPLGESLNMLLRKINTEQLISGRCGVMSDMFKETSEKLQKLPYIVTYPAEKMINWNVGVNDDDQKPILNFLVIDETEIELQSNFTWERVEKYRVLYLGDLNSPVSDGSYRQFIYRKDADSKEYMQLASIEPQYIGRTLSELPFVIANAGDVSSSVDNPPLLGLAELCLAIYRSEADYRQCLFMSGQDTLVIIGDHNPTIPEHVGSGYIIALQNQGADAKYIGVSGSGLPELRICIQHDINRAMMAAGQMLTSKASDDSSGEALKVRIAAQTATLVHVAQSGAFALQSILRTIGRWIGLSEEEIAKIEVKPNVDFVDDIISGDEMLKIMNAKAMGLPITLESIHKLLSNKGITDFTYEEEIDKIEMELNASGGLEQIIDLNLKDKNSLDANSSSDVGVLNEETV